MRKTGTVLLSVALASATGWAVAGGDKARHGAASAYGTSSMAYDHSGARGAASASAGGGSIAGSDGSRVQADASAVAGGVGINARNLLSSRAASDHNVKMVFSLNTGNYLADVNVQVTDRSGNTVLNGTSDGPWLYAKLPPGSYTAKATYNGHTVTQRFSVGRGGQRVAHFRWPASVETGASGPSYSEAGGQILGTGPQEPHRY
jgi:hypothetical protein